MKLSARPESLLETLALLTGNAPLPLVQTHLAFVAARAIMAGSSLGLFDSIGGSAKTAEALARDLSLARRPTEQLLFALTSLGYLKHRGGSFTVPGALRPWLLSSEPNALTAKLLFQEEEWGFVASLESFVQSGEPVRIHETMNERQWSRYQAAMAALARIGAKEVAKAIALPASATSLLDVGGSHGLHAAALLEGHPDRVATIAELPAALPHAVALGGKLGLGSRLSYVGVDARQDELGRDRFDLVFASNLVHHFSEDEAAAFAKNAARALKPGGTFALLEFERADEPRRGDAAGALVGLYFALTSASGTFSAKELVSLGTGAGLVAKKPKRLLRSPGMVLQRFEKKT